MSSSICVTFVHLSNFPLSFSPYVCVSGYRSIGLCPHISFAFSLPVSFFLFLFLFIFIAEYFPRTFLSRRVSFFSSSLCLLLNSDNCFPGSSQKKFSREWMQHMRAWSSGITLIKYRIIIEKKLKKDAVRGCQLC